MGSNMEVNTPAKSFKSTCMTQHEYEKLQAEVKVLKAESSKLKDVLLNLSEECGKLRDENDFIMEELTQMYGPDAISDLVAMQRKFDGESNDDEPTTSSEKAQQEELAQMCGPDAISDLVAMKIDFDGDEQTRTTGRASPDVRPNAISNVVAMKSDVDRG